MATTTNPRSDGEAPIYIGYPMRGDHYHYDKSNTSVEERRPLYPEEVWLELAAVPEVPPAQSAYPGTAAPPVSGISGVTLTPVSGSPWLFTALTSGQFVNMVPANYSGGAYAPTLRDARNTVVPYDPAVWVADGVRQVVEFKTASPNSLGYTLPLSISYWQYTGTFPSSGGGGGGVSTIGNVGTAGGDVWASTVAGVASLRRITSDPTSGNAGIVVTTVGSNVRVGNTLDGSNVGSTAPGTAQLYINKVSDRINFRSLLPGTGITLTQVGNNVTIDATASGITSIDSVGSGAPVYYGPMGTTALFRRIASAITPNDGGINVSNDDTTMIIANTLTGNSLLGGTAVYVDKTTNNLNFRSLVAGANVTITNDASTITIAAAGSSGGITGVDTASLTGVPVYDSTVSDVAYIRTLLADTALDMGGIEFAAASGIITVSNTLVGNSLLGGTAVYVDKTTNNLNFRSLVEGANIGITNDANTITIAAVDVITSVITASNTGMPIVNGTTAGVTEIRTLIDDITPGFAGIVFSQAGGIITVGNSLDGESVGTTGAGTGQPYIQKVGDRIRFRSIVAGTNITVTQAGNDITIAAADSGATITAVEAVAGPGIPVYDSTDVGGVAYIRNLEADATPGNEGIVMSENAGIITIGCNIGGSNVGGGPGVVWSGVKTPAGELEFNTLGGTSNGLTVSAPVLGLITIDNTLDGASVGATGPGTGQPYIQKVNDRIQFRSIVEGTNISVTQVDDDIIISAAGAADPITAVDSIGVGLSVYDSTDIDGVAYIRSLMADTTSGNEGIGLTLSTNTIIVSNTISGTNLGSGPGTIFVQKNASAQMEFNRLAGTVNGLTVSSPSAGVITIDNDLNGNSLIGGTAVFVDKTTNRLNFRSLVAGANIGITNNANTITIAATGVITSVVNASVTGLSLIEDGAAPVVDLRTLLADTALNMGGMAFATAAGIITVSNTLRGSSLGAGTAVYVDKTTNFLNFRSLIAGANIGLSNDANTITIAATGVVTSAAPASGTGLSLIEDGAAPVVDLRTLLADTALNMGGLAFATAAGVITVSNTLVGNSLLGGTAVYVNKTTNNLNFRSLVAGANVTITNDANTITIAAADASGITAVSAVVGPGTPVYDSTSLGTAFIRNLIADTALNMEGIVFAEASGIITVSNSLRGSSLGAGTPVYVDKTTNFLNFRSLVAGANVGLSNTATTITIAVTGVVTSAAPASGTGLSLIEDGAAPVVDLRTLLADTATNMGGLAFATATGVITVSNTLVGNSLIGGTAVYVDKTTNNLNFRSLVAGANIGITNNANTITIAATGVVTSVVAASGTGLSLIEDGTAPVVDLRTLLADTALNMGGLAFATAAGVITVSNTLRGSSLGAGTAVYVDKTTNFLNFRSLVAGSNITITNDASTITIAATSASGIVAVSAVVGPGTPVYDSTSLGTAFIRNLIADTALNMEGIVFAEASGIITVSNSLRGNSLGAGTPVYVDKTTNFLNFRSLVAGANIGLSNTATTITIAVTGVVTSLDDASGTGLSLIDDGSASVPELRTLIADVATGKVGIELSEAGGVITIGNTLTGNSLLGGTAVYVNKTTNNLNFRSLVAGANVTITNDANTITIAAASGSTPTGSNEGSGAEVLITPVVGAAFEFRTLTAGPGLGITQDAPVTDEIFITADEVDTSGALVPTALDLYVSAAGNDTTGTGAIGAPYATIPRAIRDVRVIGYNDTAAITVLSGGGTFVLPSGTLTINQGTRGVRASPLVLKGERGTVDSGLVITSINTSMSVAGFYQITVAGTPSFAVGQIIQFTSGPAAGLEGFIAAVPTASQIRITYASGGPPVPAIGNTFSIISLLSLVRYTSLSLDGYNGTTLIMQDLIMEAAAGATASCQITRQRLVLSGVRWRNLATASTLSTDAATTSVQSGLTSTSALGIYYQNTTASTTFQISSGANTVYNGMLVVGNGAATANISFTGVFDQISRAYFINSGVIALNRADKTSNITNVWITGTAAVSSALSISGGASVSTAGLQIDSSPATGVSIAGGSNVAFGPNLSITTTTAIMSITRSNVTCGGGALVLTATTGNGIVMTGGRLESSSTISITGAPTVGVFLQGAAYFSAPSMTVVSSATDCIQITGGSEMRVVSAIAAAGCVGTGVTVTDSVLAAGTLFVNGNSVGLAATRSQIMMTNAAGEIDADDSLGSFGISLTKSSLTGNVGLVHANDCAEIGFNIVESEFRLGTPLLRANNNSVYGIKIERSIFYADNYQASCTIEVTGNDINGLYSINGGNNIWLGDSNFTNNSGTAVYLVDSKIKINGSLNVSSTSVAATGGIVLTQQCLAIMGELIANFTDMVDSATSSTVSIENGSTLLTSSIESLGDASSLNAMFPVSVTGGSRLITNTIDIMGTRADVGAIALRVDTSSKVSFGGPVSILVGSGRGVLIDGGSIATMSSTLTVNDHARNIVVTNGSELYVGSAVDARDATSSTPPNAAVEVSNGALLVTLAAASLNVSSSAGTGLLIVRSTVVSGGDLTATTCGRSGVSMQSGTLLVATSTSITTSNTNDNIILDEGSTFLGNTITSNSSGAGRGLYVQDGSRLFANTLTVSSNNLDNITMTTGSKIVSASTITANGSTSAAGIRISSTSLLVATGALTSSLNQAVANISLDSGSTITAASVTANGNVTGTGILVLRNSRIITTGALIAGVLGSANSAQGMQLTNAAIVVCGALTSTDSPFGFGLSVESRSVLCCETATIDNNTIGNIVIRTGTLSVLSDITASGSGGNGIVASDQSNIMIIGTLNAINNARGLVMSNQSGVAISGTITLSGCTQCGLMINSMSSLVTESSCIANSCTGLDGNILVSQSRLVVAQSLIAQSATTGAGLTATQGSAIVVGGNMNLNTNAGAANLAMTGGSTLLQSSSVATVTAIDNTAGCNLSVIGSTARFAVGITATGADTIGIEATLGAIVSLGGTTSVSSAGSYGISISGGANVTVTNLTASDCAITGIRISGGDSALKALGNVTASDNTSGGIFIENYAQMFVTMGTLTAINNADTNLTINYASLNCGTGTSTFTGSETSSGIVMSHGSLTAAGTVNCALNQGSNVRFTASNVDVDTLTASGSVSGNNLISSEGSSIRIAGQLQTNGSSITNISITDTYLACNTLDTNNSSASGIIASASNIVVGNLTASDNAQNGMILGSGTMMTMTGTTTCEDNLGVGMELRNSTFYGNSTIVTGSVTNISLQNTSKFNTVTCEASSATGNQEILITTDSSFTVSDTLTCAYGSAIYGVNVTNQSEVYIEAINIDDAGYSTTISGADSTIVINGGVIDSTGTNVSSPVYLEGCRFTFKGLNVDTGPVGAPMLRISRSFGDIYNSHINNSQDQGILIENGSNVSVHTIDGTGNANNGMVIDSGSTVRAMGVMTLTGSSGDCKVGQNATTTWANISTGELQYTSDFMFPSGGAPTLTSTSRMCTCTAE